MKDFDEVEKKINTFVHERYDMTITERKEKFKEISDNFESVSEEEMQFRAKCVELGAPIVFVSSGLDISDTIKILEGTDTQRILNDPDSWKF